jgi:cytochrome c oxidase subunit 1
MVNAGMNINYLVHNTLWVPGHFHMTVGTAVALTFMAASYWLVPQLTNRRLYSRPIGLAQVVLWFVGMTFMSNAMHRGGLLGIPRRTAEPQYTNFDFVTAIGSVAEIRMQIALGGTLLFVSTVLFLVNIHITVSSSRVEDVRQSGVLPAPLSGPDESPRVLDNLAMWTGIAVVLVVLAYALPLASLVQQQGLFGNGVGTYPAVVEVVRGHLPVLVEVVAAHLPTGLVEVLT